jgi:hypothetical protein
MLASMTPKAGTEIADASVSYGTAKNLEGLTRDHRGRWVPIDPLRQPRKIVESFLRRATMRNAQAMARACDRLVTSAADGATWQERMAAFSLIADRLDGKAVARIESESEAPSDMPLAQLVAMVMSARRADAIEGEPSIADDHEQSQSQSDATVKPLDVNASQAIGVPEA